MKLIMENWKKFESQSGANPLDTHKEQISQRT
jgi:hypothetical protein